MRKMVKSQNKSHNELFLSVKNLEKSAAKQLRNMAEDIRSKCSTTSARITKMS